MNIGELKRAGVLEFQASRVSVPETGESFRKEAEEITARAKKEWKEHSKPAGKNIKSKPLSERLTGKIRSLLKGRLGHKEVLKKVPRATIDVSQPVVTRDESRFFKHAINEERGQLFFT